MLYTPKELKGNVNISRKSPLKNFLTLSSGILGIILIIYIVLGAAVGMFAPKIPWKVEQILGKFYKPIYTNRPAGTAAEKKIQKLLNSLSGKLKPKKKYKVYVVQKKRN